MFIWCFKIIFYLVICFIGIVLQSKESKMTKPGTFFFIRHSFRRNIGYLEVKNGHLYFVHVWYITCVFILIYFLESAIRNVEEGLEVQNCLLEKETQIQDGLYKLNESSDNANSNTVSSWHSFYYMQYLYVLLFMYLLLLFMFVLTLNGSYLLNELNLKQTGFRHSIYGYITEKIEGKSMLW